MNKVGLLSAVALVLMITATLFAQEKPILTFESGTATMWAISAQAGTTNQMVFTDVPDDYTQGAGSMQVAAFIRNFGAAWGTWTDAQYTFATPLDVSGYDDIRFDMKIITKPSHAGTHISDNRNLQFVLDLYDSVYYQGTGNVVLWRYAAGTGDMNIFYYPHDKWLSPTLTGWYQVIIPIQALRDPGWYTPKADSVFHGNNIVRLGFGVDGDSSAADSVTFLIDNMRATKKQSIVQLQSMDGPATAWVIGSQPTANILATAADNPDDYVEGSGSMLVTTAIRSQAAGWGSWTDYTYNFSPAFNATASGTPTELRFWYKTITTTTAPKRLQFVVDLYDSRGGPWRWANGFGQFGLWVGGLENNAQHTWTEVAIPLLDLTVPTWASSDTYIHLDSLMSLHFGVDADSSGADSVQFLLDNFNFTAQLVTSVPTTPAGVPVEFRLEQNFPNPFNPSTKINYTIGENGNVTLKIYSVTGQLIRTVVDGLWQNRGKYQVSVDMRQFASGVYFYTLQQGVHRTTKPMVLLK